MTEQNPQTSSSHRDNNLSVASEFVEPKNSRVLNRKQIQKRLQNLKPSEYEKVIQNLTTHNKKLQLEVQQLTQMVEELIESKKMENPHVKNPLMQEQVKKAKKQLALKYESMNYIKEQLKKAKQHQLNQQIKAKVIEQRNQIVCTEQEIQNLYIEKNKIQRMYKENQLALQEYNPKSQFQDQRIKKYQQQNKIFKKEIQQLNQKFKNTQKQSQSVISKLYNLKDQQQKFIKELVQAKISNKKLVPAKKIQDKDITTLEKEVQQLKKQKKETQKLLVSQKFIKQSSKTQLDKQSKENIQLHKEMIRKRMKALNQLNLYQAKDKKQKEFLENRQKKLKETLYDQRASQTDKIIPIDFRKEWIGKNSGIAFDDSLVLDYRSQLFIRSIIIYKSPDFLGPIKFVYQNKQRKRFQSKLPFQLSSLKKLECKKYVGRDQAYLKSFSISLTNGIITKTQFRWSDGQLIVEGWQNQSSTHFNADIGGDQRPISMFGTYGFQNGNSFSLESLGCQIGKIEKDSSQ